MPASPDLVVIGASAGGIEALCTVLKPLPARFKGAVLAVLHVSSANALPQVISRCSHLRVLDATDGQTIESGCVYLAPPNFHLVVRDGILGLSRGPRENRHRPAVDPLFRSAARAFGPRLIGVILTGALDDGAAGLYYVKRKGGIAVVQDPEDAVAPDMPRNALKYTPADHCLPAAKIGALLTRLVGTAKAKGHQRICPTHRLVNGLAKPRAKGRLLRLTCPECHGPISMFAEGKLLHLRCEIGHEYSPENFSEAHTEALERALWMALRTLSERVTIQTTLARGERARGEKDMATRYAETAAAAERDIALLREVLERV